MKKFLLAVSLGNALYGTVQAKNNKNNSRNDSKNNSKNNSKNSWTSFVNTYSGATYDAAGHL